MNYKDLIEKLELIDSRLAQDRLILSEDIQFVPILICEKLLERIEYLEAKLEILEGLIKP